MQEKSFLTKRIFFCLKKEKTKEKNLRQKILYFWTATFFENGLMLASCHIKIKWQSLLTKKADFENFLSMKKQNFVFLVWTKIVIVNILVKMNYF